MKYTFRRIMYDCNKNVKEYKEQSVKGGWCAEQEDARPDTGGRNALERSSEGA